MLDGVQRILRSPGAKPEWALLVLHLSRVPPPGPRAHHRRVAGSVLDDAAGRGNGQIFALSNQDMALLFRPADGGAAVQATLARLFQADVADPAALRTLWPLPGGAAGAVGYLQACLKESERAGPATEEPGSASVIAMMDKLVQSAPAAELMHRQMAIMLRPGQAIPIVPLFREVAISTAVLEARAAASGKAQADPFLFSHLSVRLDRRMLAALTTDVPGRGNLSGGLQVAALHVNLTLAGILSDAFAGFAGAVQEAVAGGMRIAVELPFVEVFEDAKAFVLARERLRLANMSLVLDGITHHALLLSAPGALKPHLVKLNWSPGLRECGAELGAAIQALGRDRIVLHRAENETALAWGLSQGILRFQGRYVDQMLAAERMRSCPGAASCTLRQCIDRASASGTVSRSGCTNLPLLDVGVPLRPATAPVSAMAG